MSSTVLNEIVEKTAALTSAERRKLSLELLEQYKSELKKESLESNLEESRESALKTLEKQLNDLKQLLQKCEQNKQPDSKKNINLNIEWLKEHRSEYAGSYVALNDGELIAIGKTIKETDLKAKAKGVKNPLLHYIPAEDEEVWGGW